MAKVTNSVTPQGVEHGDALPKQAGNSVVTNSVTPQGVEHKPAFIKQLVDSFK